MSVRASIGAAIAALLLASCGSARYAEDATPEHLHVIIDRLPQCDYGVGYEQPLRIELLDRDGVVASTYHSGLYTGERSIQPALHVANALPGRYRIRFGRCPSLVDDPAAAATCEDPRWFRTVRTRLRPQGIDSPVVVNYYRVRARCLDAPPID